MPPLVSQAPTQPLAERRAQSDSLLVRFYERRGGRRAWSDAGVVSSQAEALRRALADAADEGLDPADYPSTTIDSLRRREGSPDGLWRLDSILTVAFFEYGSDVSRGRVSPAALDSLWRSTPQETDLVRLLELGIDSGRVAAVLRSLTPPEPGYVRLRGAAARYRVVAARGGWPIVPAGPPLAPGARSHRVRVLRRRLTAEGYEAPADSDAERVDEGLEAAIREFQDRHGLTADGILGLATRSALNVSASARLGQITVNLERWRWLPRSLGERYMVVNSAAFTLEVVENGHPVLTMRAIVGRPDWPTPIASSRVTDAMFRPVWYVPRAIAARELLPLMQRDPGYLAREGMRVFRDSTTGGREVDPATIDWSAVTESTFAYQLRQEPGPDNPLGGVKLVFWTPFDVFIHDTPARPLFSERLRAFSHGCVRVEGATELARYLLPDWPADSIRAAMTVGRERRVRLRSSLPVHLVYFTAWGDDDGKVEFRDDPYGWDERLAAALAASSPMHATQLPPLAEAPRAALPRVQPHPSCDP